MDQTNINKVIKNHKIWIETGYVDGKRANLSEANLSRANLSKANLSEANLSRANLSKANLSWADLSWANLSGADLSGANFYEANLSRAGLSGANLSEANFSRANLSRADLSRANLSRADLRVADLSGADLRGAGLSGANFYGANLSWANLSWANLSRANFYGADLSNTCLDPNNKCPDATENVLAYGMEIDSEGFVTGFRTKESQYVGNQIYEVGKEYTAPVFSTCNETSCHPGLYFSSLKRMKENYPNKMLVKIKTHISNVVFAGDKFRTRKFLVVEVLN